MELPQYRYFIFQIIARVRDAVQMTESAEQFGVEIYQIFRILRIFPLKSSVFLQMEQFLGPLSTAVIFMAQIGGIKKKEKKTENCSGDRIDNSSENHPERADLYKLHNKNITMQQHASLQTSSIINE
jgi:hypothetical protein